MSFTGGDALVPSPNLLDPVNKLVRGNSQLK